MSSLIAPAINFLILLTLLAYFLRKPVIQYSRDRHVRLREELLTAKQQLDAARTRLEDASTRMRALATEVSSLRNQFADEASRMAQKIQANAQSASASILYDAKRASESLVLEFKLELRQELAKRITQRAGALVTQKLTTAGREKVRKDFVGYLGAGS